MKELYTALIKAQEEMGIAAPDKKGARGSYASLKSLKKAAEPSLKKYGLAVHFRPRKVDGEWSMRAVLIHESGQETDADRS